MRPLNEIIQEFRTRPWWYWLGLSEPFEYEVANGRVFRVTSNNRTEVLDFAHVERWKNDGDRIVIYECGLTRIIGDKRRRLRRILEKEIPEKRLLEPGED